MSAEAWSDDRPGEGRVFAAVFPHSDDLAIFVGGTVLKLLHEGYTGYFIKTTDDDKDSARLRSAETAHRIDHETLAVVEHLGLDRLFALDYPNHYLQPAHLVELRHRLILLFRALGVDTVLTFDPWATYEENPDHVITAQAVEAACWMAGRHLDLPEHSALGIEPQRVQRRYYVARGPQSVNHVVDIAPVLARKRAAVLLHRTPLEHMWHLHRDAEPASALDFAQFVDQKVLAGGSRIDAEAFHVIDDTASPWSNEAAL